MSAADVMEVSNIPNGSNGAASARRAEKLNTVTAVGVAVLRPKGEKVVTPVTRTE